MKIKPLEDRIFLRKIDAKTETSGGILLPGTLEQEPMEGIVVAIGPGINDEKGERISPVVKINDRVVFGKWAIKDILVGDEELAVMRESDIIGILTEK